MSIDSPLLRPVSMAWMRTTLLAAIDYGINVLILFALAAAGTVTLTVAYLSLAFALFITAGFALVILSGKTRNRRDPSLTAPQVLTACGANLCLFFLAPQIAYMAVVNLFVLLSYGSLHFSQRMFLFVWFGLACILGVLLRAVSGQILLTVNTETERWFYWAIVILALGRFLAVNAEVSRLRKGMQERNRELAIMASKLADLASRDELTGLWNRREFLRRLHEERKRMGRHGRGFCIALMDVDYFKKVNDQFGHNVGDAVLQELAKVFDTNRRASDTLARYGGEEFIMLLVDASLDTAGHALERLRRAVEQHDWSRIAPGLAITVSAGVASWDWNEEILQLINRADTALYDAKSAGRNQVHAAPS